MKKQRFQRTKKKRMRMFNVFSLCVRDFKMWALITTTYFVLFGNARSRSLAARQ
jgi:hypothetical protein